MCFHTVWRIKRSIEDKTVNIIVTIWLVLIFAISVYPVYFCFISSISDGQATLGNPAFLFPVNPTLDNYKAVLRDPSIGNALVVSVLRTIIATATSVSLPQW